MRLYVCGPVTGMPDLNRGAFDDARTRLEAAGYGAVAPHAFVPSDASHEDAMRLCIARLCCSDIGGVALLAGWRGSEGARMEVEVARAIGIEAKHWTTWEREAR